MDLDILRSVEKPGRYIGGEVNQIKKDLGKVSTRVGLCYPDVYEIGMSHIGLKILYEVLNGRHDVAAERVYAPWPDMEAVLRAKERPLATLENGVPLCDLHVLGFTLQYELSYSNLINVLDLGRIPIRARDRTPDHPVVIGGGPTSFNPEPLAPIMDAIILGDGEEIVLEVVDAVMASKRHRESRLDLWLRLAEIQGCYVPNLYDVCYEADGRVAAIVPKHGAPPMVRKRTVYDLDKAPYFTSDLVPNIGIVHDRYGVEVQRGCMRGCRFCQAGYIYRPERQRSPETVRRLVREGLVRTGSEEYSLLSLSLGDYNCIEPLLLSLMDEHEGKRSAVSTPSMRLESLTPAIMDQISRVRKTGFTVAPEAGSNRLRAVINKVIDESVLIEMVTQLFARGWRSLKTYFMLGLPTETDDDLLAIVDLGARCRRAARKYCQSPSLTVSVSSFVPKSHTPFQWSPQITLDEIQRKQALLSRELKRAKLNFRRHEATSSIMEGVYSRGDRRTGEALIHAHALGARMDGWQEYHDLALWDQALAETGLNRDFYNLRRRDVSEVLPWDHIDCGVEKEWLWDDWMHALDAGGVPDCSETPCYDCGVCDHQVIHNVVFDRDAPEAAPKHRAKKVYIKRSAEDLVPMPRAPAQAAEGATQVDETAEAAEAADPLDDVCDVGLPRERRTRMRVRYARRGPQSLAGHLDVMNAFLRAFKRAEVPALFTKGMHPRMKTNMSPPIPVGAASEAEYIDVDVKRPYAPADLAAALEGQLPDGITILEIVEVGSQAPAIAASMESITWRIDPPESFDPAPVVERFRSTGPQPLSFQVKGKSRTIDLSEQVVGLGAIGPSLEVTLRAKGGARLREVLRGVVGVDPLEAPGWSVTKTRVSFASPPP